MHTRTRAHCSLSHTQNTDIHIVVINPRCCIQNHAEVRSRIFILQVMWNFTDWLVQAYRNCTTLCPPPPASCPGRGIGAHQSQSVCVAYAAVVVFIGLIGCICWEMTCCKVLGILKDVWILPGVHECLFLNDTSYTNVCTWLVTLIVLVYDSPVECNGFSKKGLLHNRLSYSQRKA